tara:strand:+ start:136 stop:441 length:306 start_codon:yes stop_codon:yes gene_type:complete
MPSDIARQIVKNVFDDDKAAAIDSINDAIGAATYNAIQQQKLNFAKQMGFELDDTAQDSADEVAAELPDNTDTEPEEVEVPAPEATAEEQPEEPETDETDS